MKRLSNRPRVRLWLAVGCLLAALTPAGPTQAWTRSRVTATSAHLDLLRDGRVRVALRVGLKVSGGWISRFDLEGLGDVELDADKPPWLLGEDGAKYVPQVKRLADGRLSIRFPNRREAPWRGRYELGLIYTSRQPHEDAMLDEAARLHMGWSLPVWSVSLDDVKVELSAPAGLRIEAPEAEHSVQAGVSELGSRSVARWQRVHLPRLSAWRVRWSVPSNALQAGGASTPQGHRTGPAPPRNPVDPGWPALLLTLLAVAKLLLTERLGRQRRLRSIPLLPLSTLTRALLSTAAGLSGWLLLEHQPELSLALLGVSVLAALCRGLRREQLGTAPLLSTPGSGRLAAARLQRLRESFGAAAWLDATTPAGLATLGALGLLCFGLWPGFPQATAPASLLLALPLWCTGTRLHGPHSPAHALLQLERLRRSWAAVPMVLQARLDRGFALQDAHLLLQTPKPEGMALRLVLADAEWLGSPRSVPALRIDAPAQGAAASRLASALPHAPARLEGGRAIHLVAVDDAAQLQQLLRWLSCLPHGQRSGTQAQAA